MDRRSGLVLGHADMLTLFDVRFTVNQNGQERVKRRRQREVHAYCIGEYLYDISLELPAGVEEVTYDPFEFPFFYIKETKEPIHAAYAVYFKNKKCYAAKTKEDVQ